MKELLIFFVVVFASVAYASFALGKNDPSARFALGAVLIATLLPPLVSAIGNIDLSPYGFYEDTEISETSENAARSAVETGLVRAVSDEFSISEEDVSVSLSGFDLETLRSDEVKIVLRGSAALSDIGGIRRFVEKNGFGDCTVEVVFDG